MVYGIELKDLMERFSSNRLKTEQSALMMIFSVQKRRKEGCNKQHVWNWLKLFLLYFHMDMDRKLFVTFLVAYGG